MAFRICFGLLAWSGVASLLPGQSVRAACVIEAPAPVEGKPAPLIRHLAAGCTQAEREANAVSGAAVIAAIIEGQPVDLSGVVIHGEVSFDTLPVEVTQLPKGLSSEQRAALSELNANELRLVRAPVTIRDSIVTGTVRHRSRKGTLQFERPLDLRGTTFRDGVDLSRSVFQGGLDLSGAQFDKEAYFVQDQFGRVLACKDTKFGPHTRFHRSVFRGPVECTGAVFDGMAEFLEVSFEQPLTMERTRFGSGTGFSGSRFLRRANFSEAIFSRETFFTYSVFDGDVSFAGAQFLAGVDFSDAEFKRPDDLAKARFDQAPRYARAKRTAREDRNTGLLQSPVGQYAVTLSFLLVAALLLAYAFKMK
jgi:uncharacterized protein YjbI with pentapeptide repeats